MYYNTVLEILIFVTYVFSERAIKDDVAPLMFAVDSYILFTTITVLFNNMYNVLNVCKMHQQILIHVNFFHFLFFCFSLTNALRLDSQRVFSARILMRLRTCCTPKYT